MNPNWTEVSSPTAPVVAWLEISGDNGGYVQPSQGKRNCRTYGKFNV